jgi:hypothetical protein
MTVKNNLIEFAATKKLIYHGAELVLKAAEDPSDVFW